MTSGVFTEVHLKYNKVGIYGPLAELNLQLFCIFSVTKASVRPTYVHPCSQESGRSLPLQGYLLNEVGWADHL